MLLLDGKILAEELKQEIADWIGEFENIYQEKLEEASKKGEDMKQGECALEEWAYPLLKRIRDLNL